MTKKSFAWMAAVLVLCSLAIQPAFAASPTIVSGGMVAGGSPAPKAQPLTTDAPAAAASLPSCSYIRYNGPHGYIDVQTTFAYPTYRVAWGVTMAPYNLSRGRWDVDTYLSGKKTTSGFHQTTITDYTPHGNVPGARVGQTFKVVAKLVSAVNGRTYYSVTNECRVN